MEVFPVKMLEFNLTGFLTKAWKGYFHRNFSAISLSLWMQFAGQIMPAITPTITPEITPNISDPLEAFVATFYALI